MLLITDRPHESRDLQRSLGLASPCVTVGLHMAAETVGPVELIVSDVALDTGVSVGLLRAALAHYRLKGTPLLCLLRNPSYGASQQAMAVGATETLLADAPRSVLVETVAKLRAPAAWGEVSRGQQIARMAAARAGVGMADMLDAARRGDPISPAGLNVSATLVLDAIETAETSAWLDVVWKYDDMTYQHCLLVAGLAASFSKNLSFHPTDRLRLVNAALLHDIGKARIPLAILNKPGRLAEAELAVMQTHPPIGHEMLARQGGFDADLLDVVRGHHELLDGSGYPDGRSGGAIPDIVRLTTICDIFAALIERRPYKMPMAPTAAFSVLKAMEGKLDPALLHAFRRVVVEAERK